MTRVGVSEQILGLVMLILGVVSKVSPEKIEAMFEHLIRSDVLESVNSATHLNVASTITSYADYMMVAGGVAIIVAVFGLVAVGCLVKWMLILVGAPMLQRRLERSFSWVVKK